MTHEALCPARSNDELPIALQAWSPDCQCALITTVRADERQAEANRRAERFGVWHDYRPELP